MPLALVSSASLFLQLFPTCSSAHMDKSWRVAELRRARLWTIVGQGRSGLFVLKKNPQRSPWCVVCISTCFATLLTASDWVSCVPWFCLVLFLILLYIVGGLLASVLSLLFLFFWVLLALHGLYLFYVRFFFGDKLRIFLFWLPLFAGECCHLLFLMRVTPWFSVTMKFFSFNFVVTLFFFLPLFLNLHSFPIKFVSTLKVTLLISCWCKTDFKVTFHDCVFVPQ